MYADTLSRDTLSLGLLLARVVIGHRGSLDADVYMARHWRGNTRRFRERGNASSPDDDCGQLIVSSVFRALRSELFASEVRAAFKSLR